MDGAFNRSLPLSVLHNPELQCSTVRILMQVKFTVLGIDMGWRNIAMKRRASLEPDSTPSAIVKWFIHPCNGREMMCIMGGRMYR
jgi:hypothetical protein